MTNIPADALAQYVLLFSDCVLVSGHTASAIYDLTRGRISTFPSAYAPILELFRTHRVGEILEMFDEAELHAFLGFLLDNEYATFVADLAPFPEVAHAWDAPGAIDNAIIDIKTQHHDYPRIIAALDALGCAHLQIRGYSRLFGIADVLALARLCHGTSIQTLQPIIAHDPMASDDDYVALVTAQRRVVEPIVHSAGHDRRIRVDHGVHGGPADMIAVEIVMTTRTLASSLDCGAITRKQLLSPSRSTFNELHHFNGCLNRKLSIDEHGEVRNCPAMARTFGDHRSVVLSEVVATASFQRAWTARKDAIKVCQDCAYRYACTDCRAFLETPDDDDSKPLKCGYDPYTDTWADWRARPGATATLAGYRERRYLPVVRT